MVSIKRELCGLTNDAVREVPDSDQPMLTVAYARRFLIVGIFQLAVGFPAVHEFGLGIGRCLSVLD